MAGAAGGRPYLGHRPGGNARHGRWARVWGDLLAVRQVIGRLPDVAAFRRANAAYTHYLPGERFSRPPNSRRRRQPPEVQPRRSCLEYCGAGRTSNRDASAKSPGRPADLPAGNLGPMKPRVPRLVLAAVLFAAAMVPRRTQAAPVEFAGDVAPILETSCVGCHGPKRTENALRLDDRAALLKGGDHGPAIRPRQGRCLAADPGGDGSHRGNRRHAQEGRQAHRQRRSAC
jgi:mono/diheme cytochrome c family protein